MNLLDTYVSEVGRHLPRKTHSDIEAEIRSILQDMLEERSQKAGKPADEEITLEVLKEYGAPEKVAAAYLGERYLIGPRFYPAFMLVLRIVLMVIGVLAAIGLGVALYQTTLNTQSVFETIIRAIANFGAAITIALGNIVLIFAIVEWSLSLSGGKLDVKGLPKEKDWDPRSLFKVMPANQIKLGEVIIEIVGCFAAIVIFNFYPQIIGFTPSLNSVIETGSWNSVTFVSLLSAAFFYYIPYLTLVWALTIILDIILLRIGSWNMVTRICLIGLKIINIIIAAAMLAGPSLIAISSAPLINAVGVEGAHILISALSHVIPVLLWITILGNSIEIIKAFSRMISSRPLPFEVSG